MLFFDIMLLKNKGSGGYLTLMINLNRRYKEVDMATTFSYSSPFSNSLIIPCFIGKVGPDQGLEEQPEGILMGREL